MVDMGDLEPPASRRREPQERVEEGNGVRSSAARDEHGLARAKHLAAVGGGGDGASHPGDRRHTRSRGELRADALVAVVACGGGSWIRTRDIPGMNRLLYHLS